MELAIRDLKDQALAHFPSGKFLANAAWTVIAALAHNLLRWTTLIGLPDTIIPTARTLRRRLLTVPGRITRTARTVTLRMPARWPWETQFLTALERLRAVPATDLTARTRGHENDRRRTLGLGLPEPRPIATPRRPQLAPPAPAIPRRAPQPRPSARRPHPDDRSGASYTCRTIGTVDRGLARPLGDRRAGTANVITHTRPRHPPHASLTARPDGRAIAKHAVAARETVLTYRGAAIIRNGERGPRGCLPPDAPSRRRRGRA